MPDLARTPGGWLPLTLPQLDFWEEFALHPELPLSTVAHYLELEGDVDEDALVRAIAQTAREAEVLSIRFREDAEGKPPEQRCEPDRVPTVHRVDLRTHAEPLAEAERQMQLDLDQTCDLRRDPLSAQVVFRIGESRYLWYLRAHHIVVDGYALALIEKRCGQLYAHFRGRGEAGPPFHPFTTFLAEEEAYRGGARWQADRAYWSAYLDQPGALPVLDKGAEDYGTSGRHHHARLPDAFGAQLRRLASSVDIGWPDLLVSLAGAYLHRALPREDAGAHDVLTLWLPFMSRWGSVGAYLPAMLVNILPFHLTLQPGETLAAFLRRSASQLRKQRAHGRYRIEQIAADHALGKRRRYFFSPLINVLPFMAAEFDGCRVRRHVLASGVGDGLNLTFRGNDDASELTLHVEADASIGPDTFAQLCELPAFLTEVLAPDKTSQPLATVLEERAWRAR